MGFFGNKKNQIPNPQAPLGGSPRHSIAPQNQRPHAQSRFPTQPQSVQGGPTMNEPVLPEDDMATFFRNRSVVAGAPTITSKIIKVIFLLIVIAALFVVIYNESMPIRIHSNKLASELFDLDLSKHIPSYGNRGAKRKANQHAGREKKYYDKNARELENDFIPIDPIYNKIRLGQWDQVDSRLNGKCLKWTVSQDCLIKGLYLTHRGLQSSARAFPEVGEEQLNQFNKTEKALWFLTLAMAKNNGAQNAKHFDKAMVLVPSSTPDLKRFILDEMIMSAAIGRRPNDIAFFIERAKKIPASTQWQGIMTKWKAVAISMIPNGMNATAASSIIAQEKGALRADPRALEIVTPAMIRAGAATRMPLMTGESINDAIQTKMHRELIRKALQSHIRVLMASGKRGEATQSLNRYTQTVGADGFSNHFLASALLLSGNQLHVAKAISHLTNLGSNSHWHSYYALSFALIRSNQSKAAVPVLRKLQSMRLPQTATPWISLLKAEEFLTYRKFKEADKILSDLSRRQDLFVSANDAWRRSLEAQGKRDQAASLKAKIDGVRSKPGYWASEELLKSPIGPLALTP